MLINQDKIKKNLSQVKTTKKDKQSLHIFLKNLPYKEKNILDTILYYGNVYGNYFDPSQNRIANKSGSVRETANRKLAEFEKRQWITKHYRHRKTCIYQINPIFYDLELRRELQSEFKSFRWLPLNSLLYQSEHLDQKVTPYKEKNFINIKSKTTLCYITTDSNVGRVVMNNDAGNFNDDVSKIIKNLNLKLTEEQIKEISTYPITVIRKAAIRQKAAKDIFSPSGYFMTVCRNLNLTNPENTSESSNFKRNYSNDKVIITSKNRSTGFKFEGQKDNKRPIMYTRFTTEPENEKKNKLCYKLSELSLEELQEELVETQKQLVKLQEIPITDIRYTYISIIIKGMETRLQNLEKEINLKKISN